MMMIARGRLASLPTLGLVSVLALVFAAQEACALTPAEVFAKVSPSVWRVRTYDKEGLPLAMGSAVVVGPERLVTNCHVLRRASRFVVARDKQTVPGTLELWDTARDLCQIKAAIGADVPAVVLADSAKLAVGQNVYALGSPEGLELTLSAGLLSSLRRDSADRLTMIQTSAPISPGSSGGGLFDEQGRLVGLTTMISAARNAQNLNFALPAGWITELPQRHAEARQAATSASQPARTAASDAAAPPAAAPAVSNP
jgi:S1-C subfamily serine protease